MKNDFQPDYTNLLKVLYNQRPDYLPLYEHNIDEPFIAKMLGREVDSTGKSGADLEAHYRVVTEFWRANTYDALSYEAKICEIYPDHGAILGGRLGPIQTRADFDRYPWDEIPDAFFREYDLYFEALRLEMPAGMMALSAVFHCAKSGASASVLTSTHSHSLSCPSESGQAKVI